MNELTVDPRTLEVITLLGHSGAASIGPMAWRSSAVGAAPEAMCDEELVQAVASGDERCLEALYDRYGSFVYSIVSRIVVDRDLAQDATQEAFLAAWNQASRFSARRGEVRTWLASIAHHKAVDVVRSQRASRDRVADAEAAAEVSSIADETVAEHAAEHDALAGLVGTLSPEHRQVVLLTYFGGYTSAELSRALDLPEGTVKSRLFSAMRHLRSHVESDGW